MKSEVVLREPSNSEFLKIAEFSFENFVLETSHSTGESVESLKTKFGGPPQQQRPNDIWLVVELNNKNIGYVWFETDSEKKFAFGWDIYLEPENRSKGIGRQVMNLCCDHLRQNGIESVKICVYKHNNIARALYESLGFNIEKFDEERCQFTLRLDLAEVGLYNRN